MISLLKKHKYKLLTLMLSLVSIFTLLLGINKTYAYETNQLTYTIDIYSDANFTNEITTQNVGDYNGILINSSSINNNNQFLYFKMKNNTTYTKKYYFLMNWGYWNGTDWDWSLSTKQVNLNIYNNDKTIQQSNYNLGGISNNGNYLTYPYFNTFIARNINTTDNNNYIYGSLNISNYSSSYNLFIQNIDVVSVEDIGITQYYDTYYGQIEDNYNTLLSDYNDLQDNYNTLDANYNSLQNNYDTLQENYYQLNGNINNLNDFYKYGFLSLIKNGYNDNNNVQGSYLDISYVNRSTNVVNSIDYPITLNDISNYFGNSTLSLYDLVNYYKGVFDTNINSNNDYYIYSIDLNLYFQSSYGIDYLDFTNHDFNYEMELFIRDNVNNYSLYLNDLDNTNTHINSELILQKNSNLKMFDYIGFTYIVYNSDTLRPYISLNNVSSAYYQSGFDNGYESGIQQGRDSQQSTINNLNEQVNNLTNQVNELEQENQYQYNSGYQNGLNVGASQNLETNGMKTLFNSILSYPVNMIKSVFDFDFMGINISSLIMFIISIGIVAFVIKKFL